VSSESKPAVATIAEVARIARVSIATVSRALNGTGPVAQPTRRRIDEAVESVGYIPNAQAQGLRRGRTSTIGFLVNDIAEPYFATVLQTLSREVRSRSGVVIAFDYQGDQALQADALTVLMQSRISALCIASPGGLPETWIERLRKRGVRVVYFDDRPDDPAQSSVTLDDRGGARMLTRELLELGHRRIGFISGTLDGSSGSDRRDGHIDALHDYGVSSDPALIRGFGWGVDTGRQATRELLALDDPPTAIVALDARAAVGAHVEIRVAGRQLPRDISLVSFSDAPHLEYLDPPVTALVGAGEATGLALATALTKPAHEPYNVRVQLELVERASTAPPPR
jgi:LacI family transcriptional regulator, galactose operon repressor